MASVTIMASVTYGKCDLRQVWLMASVTFGKCIMANEIMAKILWQMKLSPLSIFRNGLTYNKSIVTRLDSVSLLFFITLDMYIV